MSQVPSGVQQQAALSAVELSSSMQSPGPLIIRKIALAHAAHQHFKWDVDLTKLACYAGPDQHGPVVQLLAEVPLLASSRFRAITFGRKMGLQPHMIAVWSRKVRPLALWEDRFGFKSLLESAAGHLELKRLADIYRAAHTFWPSLPHLFELALGPPSAAARALHTPPEVSIGVDQELADWGEASPLPEEA